jgi:hypothetical protein
MPRGGKRVNAGLKPAGDEPITETIAIRVTASEKAMIKAKATRHKLSIGRYLVKMCREEE